MKGRSCNFRLPWDYTRDASLGSFEAESCVHTQDVSYQLTRTDIRQPIRQVDSEGRGVGVRSWHTCFLIETEI
jgi:hypothetical protein